MMIRGAAVLIAWQGRTGR